jgi:glucose-1-phosphate cytidylyltransferase
MKVVILAGGLGTRLVEETAVRPKPMVEIGGKPILWHIMKNYSAQGCNEFVLCLGFRGYYIKEFFSNYFLHMSDVTFDMRANKMEVHAEHAEPWRVTLIDTGENTMTGGRVKRIRDYVANDEVFALTYGDGVANIDLAEQLKFHRQHGRLATVTAVRPAKRFGLLDLDGDRVAAFSEKPEGEGGWISGGFFLLSPKVLHYIDGDETTLEREPLAALAADDQLRAFVHNGFWAPMDTLRDKIALDDLWSSGEAPWKIW